jgi:hypothetical protein
LRPGCGVWRINSVLGEETFHPLTRIIQLLTTSIPNQRKSTIRDDTLPYLPEDESPNTNATIPYPNPDS